MGNYDPVQALANLPERFPQVRRWFIAYSGGLDSQVLLAAAVKALPQSSLVAIHINHQLQAEADVWQNHCEQIATSLSVKFVAVKVQPLSHSESSARDARYDAFQQALQANDALLMAHHADDQAETILFRLCRGSGVAGLVGIPEVRQFNQALIIRPFLEVTRSQLRAWANQLGLKAGVHWIEDPSNAVEDYDRNYLRLAVLPSLQKRWPHLVQRFVETSKHMAQAQSILTEVAEQDLLQVLEKPEVLNIPSLLTLSVARQDNLLRAWLARYSVIMNEKQSEQLRIQFLSGGANPERSMKLNDLWCLRTYRKRLFISPQSRLSLTPLYDLKGSMQLTSGQLTLPDSLTAQETSIFIDFNRGTEKIHPMGRGVGKTIKQLFQENGVPPWLREQWPLVCDSQGVLLVPGLCFDRRWQKKEDSVGSWQPFGLSDQPFFVSLQYHLDPS